MAGDELVTTLNGLGVRCVKDLQYLCMDDVVNRLKLPLVDERKFLCMLTGTAATAATATATIDVCGNKSDSRLPGDCYFLYFEFNIIRCCDDIFCLEF